MGFFDLNIPYLESSKVSKHNTRLKETRLKIIGKSMELGYTGIAYNRTITGVMSDNDFCTISIVPLSSLLKLSPAFHSSVKLHREALGVRLSSPFRQYTRLTVVVDNVAQASSLNSGNPILKTYDLVAVRPTNQTAFDQACLVSEVDIISIDFSENKPFRLRQPMVKAAIKRGLYFEIAYSDFLIDTRTRRKVIDNAKLLMNWTRGKNILFSSAAPSVNELRGPYDAANLMSLLGVSTEQAKAAISQNCRSLIANALRKKQCYKEITRVELATHDQHADSNNSLYGDWLNFDSISSGEGDLLLEDMAKSFSASNQVIKTVKAIDFASTMKNLPSHGLQLKNIISEEPKTDISPFSNPVSENTIKSQSVKQNPEDLRNDQEIISHTIIVKDEAKDLSGIDVCFAPIEKYMHNSRPQDCNPRFEPNNMIKKSIETQPNMEIDIEGDDFPTFVNQFAIQNKEDDRSIDIDVPSAANVAVMNVVFSEIDSNDQTKLPLAFIGNMSFNEHSFEEEQVKKTRDEAKLDEEIRSIELCKNVEGKYSCFVANGEKIREVKMEEQDKGKVDDEILHQTLHESTPEVKDGCTIANGEEIKEVINELEQIKDHNEIYYPITEESTSGKNRRKQRSPIPSSLSPLKHSLNPVPFKKKSQKSKRKAKLV